MRLALFVPIYYALSFVLTVARSIVNVLHYNKYHLELRFYDVQITRDKYFPSITKYTVFNLSGGGNSSLSSDGSRGNFDLFIQEIYILCD